MFVLFGFFFALIFDGIIFSLVVPGSDETQIVSSRRQKAGIVSCGLASCSLLCSDVCLLDQGDQAIVLHNPMSELLVVHGVDMCCECL